MPSSARTNGHDALSPDHPLCRMSRQETSKITLPPPAYGPNYNENPDNEAFRQRIGRDFRSDTLTMPTPEMFEAMAKSSLGDDFYEEDENSNCFQAEIAALAGKEDALFVMSGTLSNQLAIRTHLKQPPYSILCDSRSHIHRYEGGGASFHSGASTQLVAPSNSHHLTWKDISPNLIRGSSILTGATRLICLENTLNGLIVPQEVIVEISENAKKEEDLKLHLDGARIFEVAAETGMSLKELLEPFDSASICFSKGIGAPYGSMLVGRKDFILKARHFRKLFGAGGRQTGCLAQAARVALTTNFSKLKATHEMTRYLASSLEELGVEILSAPETNMFFLDPSPIGFSPEELSSRAKELENPILIGISRVMLHYQINPKAIVDLIDLVKEMKQETEKDPVRLEKVEEWKRMREERWNEDLERAHGRGRKGGNGVFGITDTGYMRVVKRKREGD